MAPPANDNWADATTLAGLIGTLTSQSNVDATIEAGEPAPYSGIADDSIWYKITPAADSSITVDTKGSLPDGFDTVLGVYTGTAVDSLTLVAGDDDGAGVGYLSSVTWAADAGTTYYVRLHDYDTGGSGSDQITVNWVVADPPPEPGAAPAGLYGVVRRAPDAGHSTQPGLYRIDTTSGALTKIVDFAAEGLTSELGTLSHSKWKPMFRPADGACWVNNFDNELFVFDVPTGSHLTTHSDFAETNSDFGGGAWHSDMLYFQDQDDMGSLVRFDPATSSFTTLVDNLYNLDPSFWAGEDSVVAGDRMYNQVRNHGAGDSWIWSCLLDGTDLRLEYTETTGTSLLGITVIGDHIYGADMGSTDRILRWPVGTDGILGPVEVVWTMVTTPTAGVASVTSDGTSLFAADNLGHIYKIDSLAAPTSETLLVDTHDSADAADFADLEYIVWWGGLDVGPTTVASPTVGYIGPGLMG